MPKYVAYFKEIKTVSATFEANSFEEAEEIAKNHDKHYEIFAHQLDDEEHEFDSVEEW